MAAEIPPAQSPQAVAATTDERPRALVVGGSGGLGAGVCHALAADGWNVIVTYCKGKDAADHVVQTVQERGCEAIAVRMDLTAPDKLRDIVDGAAAGLPLSAVVYAAGPYVPQRYLSTIGWPQYQEFMVQDSVGCFAVLVASLPHLRRSQGCIVALTSTAVSRYEKRDVLSAAPKAAVELLVRAVATEEGRYGVRANCVAVGMIEGGMYDELIRTGDMTLDTLEEIRMRLPLQRLGSIADVANAVTFLASSEKSGWITGQSLHVDGGHSI